GRLPQRRRIGVTAIVVSFDPKRVWIHDLEQEILGLHDLARDDARDCDHAIDGCAQGLRLDSDFPNDVAAATQAFQLEFRFGHQGWQRDAAFGEEAQPPKPRLRDRDELLDFAGFFRNRRAVRLLQRTLDFCQNVALGDGLADMRQAAVWRD